MQVGAQLHNNSTSWQDISAVARTVDAGRWSSLWVYDHFFPPVDNLPNDIPTFEAYSLLAGLAATTERVRLGTLVTAGMTNLMADGPAAAAVGPVTLNMAAVTSPGTSLIPPMGLATACASSFAYLLVIGTPPTAIVYASGYLEPLDYLRAGAICFVIALVVVIVLSQVYWPLVGWQGMPAA